MHSVYVDEVRLHSPFLAELQFVVCVIVEWSPWVT